MNPRIEKLKLQIPETEQSLAEAKRLSDAVTVMKLTRLLRNQKVYLTLLQADKAKRLGDVEIDMTAVLPE